MELITILIMHKLKLQHSVKLSIKVILNSSIVNTPYRKGFHLQFVLRTKHKSDDHMGIVLLELCGCICDHIIRCMGCKNLAMDRIMWFDRIAGVMSPLWLPSQWHNIF